MVQACNYKNEIDSNYYCQKLKLSCVKNNKIALFETSKGNFEVKLFGKDNPVTVSNFIENVNKNIYVNKKFIFYFKPSKLTSKNLARRAPSSST